MQADGIDSNKEFHVEDGSTFSNRVSNNLKNHELKCISVRVLIMRAIMQNDLSFGWQHDAHARAVHCTRTVGQDEQKFGITFPANKHSEDCKKPGVVS
jgi:hypothetical protein